MTANNKKSYLDFLNKFVDEYNNTYHHSIDKKSVDAYYSALIEEIETYDEGKWVVAERFIRTLKSIKSIKEWQLIIKNLILIFWINL